MTPLVRNGVVVPPSHPADAADGEVRLVEVGLARPPADGHLVDDEAEQDPPRRHAGDERLGAVDGVDDPADRRVVAGRAPLLADDLVVGPHRADALPQQRLDAAVGLGDGVPPEGAALVVGGQRRAEVVQGELGGLGVGGVDDGGDAREVEAHHGQQSTGLYICPESWLTARRAGGAHHRRPASRSRRRVHRHRRHRLHRHAGPAPGQAVPRPLLRRRGAPHAAEACNYLLAVDVEMNTVDGYAMSSWETGYGDFVLRPDLATLRPLPVAPRQRARGLRPRVARRHAGGRVAPADPAPPARPAGRARPGAPTPVPSSSSSCSRTPTAEPGTGATGPHPGHRLQRRLLAARLRPARSRCCVASATT